MGNLMEVAALENLKEWEGISLEQAAKKTGEMEEDLLRLIGSEKLSAWCWIEDYPTVD
ncbi:MAG: hypothetical protein V2B20_28385 [Pseudomonadota bacterium]